MLHLNSHEVCSFGKNCKFSLECYGLRSDRPNEFICEFWEDENARDNKEFPPCVLGEKEEERFENQDHRY